jgi:hypothetical protein
MARRRDIVEAIGRQAVLADEAPVETLLRFIAAHLDSLPRTRLLLLVDRESCRGGRGSTTPRSSCRVCATRSTMSPRSSSVAATTTSTPAS